MTFLEHASIGPIFANDLASASRLFALHALGIRSVLSVMSGKKYTSIRLLMFAFTCKLACKARIYA
jgi:hypothetical protein